MRSANGTSVTMPCWPTYAPWRRSPIGSKFEVQGTTHEGRPLALLTITSPRNHARLDQIRKAHLEGGSELPVVIWLGYSIHGNEASGSNAAPLTVYHLAAARGEAIDQLLEHAVILIDPSLNPDGLGRFATWANSHRGMQPVADPNHREHREAWPGGRTNHYWFDLNRDWLLVQQPESRARGGNVSSLASEPAWRLPRDGKQLHLLLSTGSPLSQSPTDTGSQSGIDPTDRSIPRQSTRCGRHAVLFRGDLRRFLLR